MLFQQCGLLFFMHWIAICMKLSTVLIQNIAIRFKNSNITNSNQYHAFPPKNHTK